MLVNLAYFCLTDTSPQLTVTKLQHLQDAPNPFSQGITGVFSKSCSEGLLKSPTPTFRRTTRGKKAKSSALAASATLSGKFLSSKTHPLLPYLYPGPASHDGGNSGWVQSKWGPGLLGMHQSHPSNRDRPCGEKNGW